MTVKAASDADAVDDSATISVTASGGGYGAVTGSVSVTVDDDDEAGLTLSTATLSVDEGSNATFTVVLDTQPTGDVTVTVGQTGTANTDVTAAPASLTFTDSNWNTAQTVTVSGAADDDAVDDVATLRVSATGGGYGGVAHKDVSVTVEDDDTAGFTLPSESVSVNEGSSETFDMRLSTQPSGSVTVTLSQPTNTDVTVDTDTSTPDNQTTLTFTDSNWNTAQTVTVKAASDADAVDDSATVSVTASGGGYGAVAGSVSVTVDDDDTAGLTVSTATLSVNEGLNATFTVKLDTEPTGDVTVAVSQTGTANTDVTAAPASLTFTTSNWGTAQTVTVSGAADDDAVDDVATLRVSATGGGYDDVVHKDVSVTVEDDDTAGLTVSKATLSVNEDSNATFTVKLATQPTGNVTVAVGQPGTANTDVTVDTDTSNGGNQDTLTFTTSNWDTAQTVTVSGAADDDAVDDVATLRVSATGGGYDGVAHKDVSVTVEDDDTAGFTLPSESVSVNEGSSETFDMRLSTQPSGSVTVTLSQPTNTDVTVDTDTSTPDNQTTLTFTASNWNTTQRVTVKAASDADAVDDSATISVTASGGGYGAVTGSVSVTVDDDDEAGLTLSTATLSVDEGSNATFTVVLDTQPTGDVTVTVGQTGTANTDVTAAPASLTFTDSNWNTAQTVTVSGAADDDAVDDVATLRVSATGGGYGGVAHKDVSVTVEDDDTAGFTLPSESVSVNEGSSETFDMRLSTQPSGSVTVTLSQPTNTDVTVDTDTSTPDNQTTLTFTDSNWNTAQTVTVKAASDADAVDDSATVSVTASGGGYGAVAGSVSVTVDDDDTAGLTVSTATLSVNEGLNATFTVKLDTEPTGDVTVAVSQTGTANTDVTAAPASLTFTTSNWGTAQTVTVSGAADDDAVDDVATLRVSATGGGYDDVVHKDVSVTVEDDDTAGLTVSKATLSVNEDSNATFTVKLATQPTGNVTVAVGQPGTANTDVTVDTDTSNGGNQDTLTFTTSNWDTAQTVTVSGAADDDAVDDVATLRVSATGGGYGGVAHKDVSVTVEDDDTAGFTLPSESVSVNEGSSETFDMRLSTQPSGSVTVTLSQPTNTDVTVDTDTSTPDNQTTLTFTASNWNTTQRVTVKAASDADAVDDSATISVTASGGGYGAVTGSVSVTVDDDDEAGLTLSTATLSVDEGSNATFTVVLDTQPTGDVTVTVGQTGTANTDVTAAPASLTFTDSNWNTAQTVTVSGAADDDAVDDVATLRVSATGGGYGGVAHKDVSVTVEDDDTAGFTLPSESVSVNEGSSETFDMRLSTQPSGSVTVTLSQPTNTDVTVDTDTSTPDNQTTLTFTDSNWNTAQTVTVKAASDADAVDDSATVSVTASGGGYGAVAGSVSVTVDDDDTAGLTVSTATLSVNEGLNATFTVKLDTEPTGDVTVAVSQTGTANTDVTAAPASLTFTTSNWGTAQTVTVSGAADDDAVDDVATLRVSATGGGYDDVVHKDVSVTVE